MKSWAKVGGLVLVVLTLGANKCGGPINLCPDSVSAATVSLDGRTTTMSYEVRDGLALAQGDIVLGRANEVAGPGRSAPITTEGAVWPNGVIPYQVDASIDFQYRLVIFQAVLSWTLATGLAVGFVDCGTCAGRDHYVRIVHGNGVCNRT